MGKNKKKLRTRWQFSTGKRAHVISNALKSKNLSRKSKLCFVSNGLSKKRKKNVMLNSVSY